MKLVERLIPAAWLAAGCVALAGCASTAPTQIGADTYFAAKTNTAGMFGNPAAVAGSLMVEGSKYCAARQREFELVTENTSPARPGASLGGASITFKCVVHAGGPVMRPDNGVSTVTTQ